METAFFWKWWLRQDEKVRADVKMLINEGRLEIIGGAWSMNDEACTHYHSIVDQFTWGFRYLFNYIVITSMKKCPRKILETQYN